jgi:hypothetical protein
VIIKLALLEIKRLPKAQLPQEQALEQADKVVHLSRPNPGKLKTPIRIVT